MKPLVTTVAALRELATGITPDAVGTSPVLHEYAGHHANYLIGAEDTESSQRIVINRSNFATDPFVPPNLTRNRREVLSRMAAFAERARLRPFSLPRGWSQYKSDNFVAFFAVPSGDSLATRWITEVAAGDSSDVVFWGTTNSSRKSTLEEFAASQLEPLLNHAEWLVAAADAEQVFTDSRRSPSSGIDMNLPVLTQSLQYVRTYSTWMNEVSSDQRAFIEAPTDKSIRLRGPAGSGKTLALTLKSLREFDRIKAADESAKVLFVTHSWALAAQVQASIDSMGIVPVPDIDVFPLLAVAQSLLPKEYLDSSVFSLVGDDSLSSKQAQLDEIRDLIGDFRNGDWVSFQGSVSPSLRERFSSEDPAVLLALAWDLLIEFGSVIGASGIFPGAGSQLRYFQLTRASWMLPLQSKGDLRVVFELYERYVASLETRSLVTSDQLLADFVSFLETHAWNRRRKAEGYDLIFVDEFHLFSPLERQVLQYLTRDVSAYPRLFMAADPRQSPSSAFIGTAADETRSSDPADGEMGDVSSFELTTVHRFTPQILNLIKHVHLAFPTLFLGHEWDIDFSRAESSQEDGPTPRLIHAANRWSEEADIYDAIREMYSRGRIAVAVVDSRQWGRFNELASLLARSGRFHVTTVTGRSDIEGLRYRSRGVVIGAAEHLAGLQFDFVLAAGVPDMHPGALSSSDKTRLLSMLYLALSRSEKEVRVFTNEDDGGIPDVLIQASKNGHIKTEEGRHA